MTKINKKIFFCSPGLFFVRTHRVFIKFLSLKTEKKCRLNTLFLTQLTQRSVKTSIVDWKPIKSKVKNISEHVQSKNKKFYRFFLFSLMLTMPILTFFLGVWQYKRLKWKTELISRCEESILKEPIKNLPKNLNEEICSKLEFRRFFVKGRFNYNHEMFIGPRIKNGEIGYLLVTPFIRSDDGTQILVERGWIKDDKIHPNLRKGPLSHLSLPKQEITIQAIFRLMPKKKFVHLKHTENSRQFNFPDVYEMAKESNSLPIYCQALYDLKDHLEWREEEKKNKLLRFFLPNNNDYNDALFIKKFENDVTTHFQENNFINEGVPLGVNPEVTYKNNHFQYLITWFGLSFASSILFVYTFYKKKKFLSVEKIIEFKLKKMNKM